MTDTTDTHAGTAPTVGRSVDWAVAAAVGERLARPAPPVTDYTRTQVIELAAASRAAEPPVREVTGLHTEGPIPDARIVDRRQGSGPPPSSMRVMTEVTAVPDPTGPGRIRSPR